MTKRLRLLDLGLVALIVLLGWQMRKEWVSAHAREQSMRNEIVRPTVVPGPPPLGKTEALSGATYAQVAGSNLFSRDRNPNVIIDPEVPKAEPPVPPFPVARGVMIWPGVPPTVVLSEKPGGAQKGYHPGDKIADWTVLAIDNQYVVFGWNGKEFKKRIDELLDRTPMMVAEAPAAANTANMTPSQRAAAAPAPAQAQPLTNTINANAPTSGPGADIGANLRGCVAGDRSPSGTVENGYRKVVTVSPFGENCRWEPAK